MPPNKKKNLRLVNNLQVDKYASVCVQTENTCDNKYVQTDVTSDLTIGQVLTFLEKTNISDKCEVMKHLILSETSNFKLSCDESTLNPSSNIVEISQIKPSTWLLKVHPLLLSIGDALSEVNIYKPFIVRWKIQNK